MQDLMREAQYQFTWQVSDGAWAYRAPNRAHDLSLSLAADGFHAARYSAEGELLWDLGLSLAAYGEQTFPAAIAEGGLSRRPGAGRVPLEPGRGRVVREQRRGRRARADAGRAAGRD